MGRYHACKKTKVVTIQPYSNFSIKQKMGQVDSGGGKSELYEADVFRVAQLLALGIDEC